MLLPRETDDDAASEAETYLSADQLLSDLDDSYTDWDSELTEEAETAPGEDTGLEAEEEEACEAPTISPGVQAACFGTGCNENMCACRATLK